MAERYNTYKVLTKGILGLVSQIKTQRISLYVLRIIKASLGEYRLVWYTIIFAWLFVHIWGTTS